MQSIISQYESKIKDLTRENKSMKHSLNEFNAQNSKIIKENRKLKNKQDFDSLKSECQRLENLLSEEQEKLAKLEQVK